MAKDAKGHGSDRRGGSMPIPGHDYHTKTSDQLRYIAKDASDAEKATRGMSSYNPASGRREDTAGKYSDQLNNAASVLAFRARGGTDFSDKSAAQELAQGSPKSDAVPVHEGASGRSDTATSYAPGSAQRHIDRATRLKQGVDTFGRRVS